MGVALLNQLMKERSYKNDIIRKIERTYRRRKGSTRG